jgi:outer membrane beta-barrel protein
MLKICKIYFRYPMKKNVLVAIGLFILCGALSKPSYAAQANISTAQEDYERTVQAVVRNKLFYKENRLEVGIYAGVMPYDSLVNHYLVGGRLDWHITDHYGWEIIDAMYAMPTVSGYTSSTVSNNGISNLQTTQDHLLLSSNFLLSPFYGKIRLLGRQVLFYDIYLVAGLGAAQTDTIQASTANTGGSVSINTLRTGFDPMFDVGLGFKLFLNNAVGLVVDMRDYVSYSKIYNNSVLKSNFSFFVGLSFFIPTFG